MRNGIVTTCVLLLAGSASGLAGSLPSGNSPADGYLRQKAAVLVYGNLHGGNFPNNAGTILDREIRAFETFLWSGTGRKLFLDTVRIRPDRSLTKKEFLFGGTRWGHLPRISERIASDMRMEGWQRTDFAIVLILYVPPDGRDTPLAGATYLPEGISSIPLREATFLEAGRKHPLHRLLVHEYLHQVEFILSGRTGRPYLVDPDRPQKPPCESSIADPLVEALLWTTDCKGIDWTNLSPQRGIWIPR